MTYRSFLNNLPLPLQRWMADPASWAVVGSIGVHGIILALLPFMSLPAPANTEPNIENRVSVIELDAEAMERVPDFELTAPPPPNDSMPGSDIENFTLEDFLDLPNTSIQEAPPRPDPFPSRPTPQRRTFEWPSLPLPSTPPVRSRPPIQSPPQTRTQVPDEPEPETSDSESDPTPSETPDTETSETPNETETTESETTESDESETDPNRVAAAGDASETPEPQSPQERLLAEQQQLQQQFAYQEPSKAEVDQAFSAWNEVARNAEIQEGEPVNLEISQSLLTCPIGKDVTVLVGVFVNPDGSVMADPGPQILLGSGYEFFDNASQEYAAAHNFENPTEERQAYTVATTFNYDPETCASAPPEEAVGEASDGSDDGSSEGSDTTTQGESDSSAASDSNTSDS